jgi:hypothetical protein
MARSIGFGGLGEQLSAAMAPRLNWVNRVTLAVGRPLPVYPDEQTSSVYSGMSGWCQHTKSLRDSPRRWGRSAPVRLNPRGEMVSSV